MGNLFAGDEPTEDDKFEETKIDLQVAINNMEMMKEDTQYQCGELKQKAKDAKEQGNTEEALLYIRQIVRLHGASEKMTHCIIRMEDMRLNIQLYRAQNTMQKSMMQIVGVMHTINSQLDIRGMHDLIRHFEKQDLIMQDKEKLISESLDEKMSLFDNPEKEEKLMKQLMDEIGVEIELPQTVNEQELNERIKRLNMK